MIPKGTHMVAYAARDSQGSYGIVTAFFFHVGGNDVLVRRYSPSTELLMPLEDEDEEQRYSASVRKFEFDAHLAPYNLSGWATWRSLSSCITPEVLDRVSPLGGSFSAAAEPDPAGGRAATPSELELDRQLAGAARAE
ncbi:hypothetical protein H632_c3585p0, partial [Helicosporidium sp. ATCC 50920]